MNICKVLTVVGADQEEVVKAIENSDFKDFEDSLQDRCAVSVAADYIVTRNVKDFAMAETKAITPEEFCKLMENAKGNDMECPLFTSNGKRHDNSSWHKK